MIKLAIPPAPGNSRKHARALWYPLQRTGQWGLVPLLGSLGQKSHRAGGGHEGPSLDRDGGSMDRQTG